MICSYYDYTIVVQSPLLEKSYELPQTFIECMYTLKVVKISMIIFTREGERYSSGLIIRFMHTDSSNKYKERTFYFRYFYCSS